MNVQVLEAEHYPPQAGLAAWPSRESAETRSPNWSDIESAIHRLDRAKWPIVWLYTGEPCEGAMPEEAALQVMGGRGEYGLMYWDGEFDTHYHDESRAGEGADDEPIWIWESGEGAQQFRENLCDDLARVLEIVKYFAERGEPHPKYHWEAW